MPEQAQNKKRYPSRGKRDTRAGQMLDKKEGQEEPDPGQSRGRARGEARAGVRSLQSRYTSEGTVARGGTSSEHLSKKQGAVKKKEKPHTDHLLL